MKTIHKIIGLLLLVLIGYQLTTIEGYPSNSSFIVPSTGVIPDSVLDQIRVGHYSVMIVRREGRINRRLDNLFNAGLTPALVINIPQSIKPKTNEYRHVRRQLRKAMKLPDDIPLEERRVYMYLPKLGVYSKYFGRCNDLTTFKLNAEGTNCAL